MNTLREQQLLAIITTYLAVLVDRYLLQEHLTCTTSITACPPWSSRTTNSNSSLLLAAYQVRLVAVYTLLTVEAPPS